MKSRTWVRNRPPPSTSGGIDQGRRAVFIEAQSTARYEDHWREERPSAAWWCGEVLLEEFLKPMDISQYQLAKDISVPPRRFNEIVVGKRAVTVDTALRLARC